MEELSFEYKLAWIKGLLIDCPFGKAVDDCPAKDLRILPILDRFKAADRMEENQLDLIIAHHKACLAKRESRS
jgi:hypothetical protein